MPRKTRRAAWGCLTQVDADTWRFRYHASTPEGYVRRCETIHGTRMDAERRRSELMLLHSEDAPCPTVSRVWGDWYLPALTRRMDAGEMAASTRKIYVSAYTRHVEPRWGAVPCDQIRPLHVQQWIDGLGLSQAKSALSVARPLLDYAVRFGVVDANPFREHYVMPSKATVQRQDKGVWTLDELGEVWRHVRGDWYEGSFLLAAFGGLRVGESLGVRSEDVRPYDAGGCTIALVDVRRQVMSRSARTTERLKNPQSRRTVPIAGRAGARLLALADTADGWLTGDGVGGVAARWALATAWEALCAELDAPLRHPYRNLRNSWETNARWTLRLPPWLVEPMMGHAGQGVTGQYYDRPSADMLADAMADAYRAVPYDAAWPWAR